MLAAGDTITDRICLDITAVSDARHRAKYSLRAVQQVVCDDGFDKNSLGKFSSSNAGFGNRLCRGFCGFQ